MGTVDFHFDYASPFAYLADALSADRLAGHTIVHRPIYLRGLEAFSKGVPHGSAKLAYLARDLQRCAEHERVPLAAPATFPVDGLQALRGAHVARERGVFERYHRLAFRATWAESRDVSRQEVVLDLLLEALGAEADARSELVAAITSQPVKDRLRSETAGAVERGVFGVPSFFVGDELFWGHDRLDYVARAAAQQGPSHATK